MKLVDAKSAEREKALLGVQRDAGRLIAAAEKLLGTRLSRSRST
jgi:hypothetical protein